MIVENFNFELIAFKDHQSELLDSYEDMAQARILFSLARRLSHVGRLKEALIAMQEAAELYRDYGSDTGKRETFRAAVFRSFRSISLTQRKGSRGPRKVTAAKETI